MGAETSGRVGYPRQSGGNNYITINLSGFIYAYKIINISFRPEVPN